MTIQTAWIEAAYPNPQDSGGWVLAVRGEWAASVLGDFTTDQDGTPRIVVTVTGREGFARSGGAAVPAANITRSIPATRILRRAFPNQAQIDETDEGEGVRTVRLALADPVYPGETVSVSVLAGWRTGLPAQSNIPVTNNSVRPKLKPWGRWAKVHDELIDGTTYVAEMVCVSHTPKNDGASLHQPVAGVKFIASDGTNTVEAWALETTESTHFGDSLWCHRASMNLSSLTSGRITIHAEVYPWEGEVWTTRDGYWDAAHITEDFKVAARGWEVMHDPRPEKPMTIILDKDGTFLPRLHVVLHPDGTTDTNPANWNAVRSTYADAAAVANANKPATLGIALDMLAHQQRTIAAANGFAARSNHRFPGGATVWVPAGTFTMGTQGNFFTVNSGTAYGFPVVRAAPGVARSAAIVSQASALTMAMRHARLAIRGITINKTVTTALLSTSTPRYLWVDDVVTTGTAGNIRSGNPTQIFGDNFAQDDSNAFTNCVWDMGGWNNGNNGLMRNVVVGGSIATIRPSAVFGLTRTVANATTLLDFRWDGVIILNAEALRVTGSGRMFVNTWAVAGTASAPATRKRKALVNLLFERAVDPSQPGAVAGELAYNQLQDCIFDAVTMVGARFNFHNDPTGPESNYLFENSRMGVIFERQATKHDDFSSQPLHTGGWEVMCNVRSRGSYFADRINGAVSGIFQPWSRGWQNRLGSWDGGTINMGFVLDRSANSHLADKSGGGDYRLVETSPAWDLRRAAANYPVDRDGGVRGARMHAGFHAAMPLADAVMLGPLDAEHAHVAAAVVLVPGAAGLACRPDDAAHEHRADAARVAAGQALAVASARHETLGEQARLQAGGFPGADPGGLRTVVVRPDRRRVRIEGP